MAVIAPTDHPRCSSPGNRDDSSRPINNYYIIRSRNQSQARSFLLAQPNKYVVFFFFLNIFFRFFFFLRVCFSLLLYASLFYYAPLSLSLSLSLCFLTTTITSSASHFSFVPFFFRKKQKRQTTSNIVARFSLSVPSFPPQPLRSPRVSASYRRRVSSERGNGTTRCAIVVTPSRNRSPS